MFEKSETPVMLRTWYRLKGALARWFRFIFVWRRQDEHERQVRLVLKKQKLQEQDEYESISVEDGQEGPYGGPVR